MKYFWFCLFAILILVDCKKKKKKTSVKIEQEIGGKTKPTLKESIERMKKIASIKDVSEMLKFIAGEDTQVSQAPKGVNSDISTYVLTSAGGASGGSTELSMMLTECKLFKEVMWLDVYKQPGYNYFPNYIVHNKCGGGKNLFRKCLPKEYELKKYQVMKYTPPPSVQFQKDPFELYIKNPVSCHLDCEVKKKDCPEPNVYIPFTCVCYFNCPDSARTQCRFGEQWSREKCGCVCIERTCSDKQKWNQETCQCECQNTNCGKHQVLDINSCNCLDS